jgi:DNA modification methylase
MAIEYKRVKLADLHEDPANARLHPEENLADIRASLREFGQVEPLVVKADTQKVIGGNGRIRVMRELGWEECDVVYVDFDNMKSTALGIALNRSAERAEWDKDVLDKLLGEMSDFNEDLTQSFAELLEQEKDFGDYNKGLTDPDSVPSAPDQATTRRGDIWILGDHRLMCGDSSKPEDLDRLLDGQSIHLVNTDPPYNVKVEPRSNNAIAAGLSSFSSTTHHQQMDVARHPEKAQSTHKQLRPKDRPLINDFMTDQAFDEILNAWFGNIARVLEPGRGFYIWGGYANVANYPAPLKKHGLYFSQAIIWDKQHPVLTRKDFMGAHEWCFYGWKEGAAHQFFGPNNATDLWAIKKVSPQNMVHLTEKPVALAARAMEYSSKPGERVLDLFGGSGSTLVGAEQTGRKAYLMELDELYCDVIVKRWEDFTGKKAVLVEQVVANQEEPNHG